MNVASDTAAVASAPTVIDAQLAAILLAHPDALLVSWFLLDPHALEVLSQRERAHTLGLMGGAGAAGASGEAAAAAYVRERLRGGDHHAARARLLLEPGARITLGGCFYTVIRHRGQNVELRGQRHGLVDLSLIGSVWVAWFGGVAARNAKTRRYRRAPDGAFTPIP